METLLSGLDTIGLLIFLAAGICAVAGRLKHKETLHQMGLLVMAIAGPLTLFICFEAQESYRATDTIFWGRLMAGDVSTIWGIASLGLIAGSGIAVGALSLNRKAAPLYIAALFFASAWIVILEHPTPHYVPMPEWLDKLIWLGVIAGGAGAAVFVFWNFRERLKGFLTVLTLLAGLMTLVSSAAFYAKYKAGWTEVPLQTLKPAEQIDALGCLSCHTINGEGAENPGGALESVAARTETDLEDFLLSPTKETAEKLKIRNPATGEMAGVKLKPEQVKILVKSMTTLFDVKPPSIFRAGDEQVEEVFKLKGCLDCHAIKGQGAPNGGIGGNLERAAEFSEETLLDWLQNPSAENAKKLGIRKEPFGAMESFKLTAEQAAIVAPWLKENLSKE